MVQEFRVDSVTAEALVAAGGQDGNIIGVVDGAAVASYGSILFNQASSRSTSDGISEGAKRRDRFVDDAGLLGHIESGHKRGGKGVEIGSARQSLVGVDNVRKVSQIVRVNHTDTDGLVQGCEVVSTVSDVEEFPVVGVSPVVLVTSRRQQCAGGCGSERDLLCSQADVPIDIVFQDQGGLETGLEELIEHEVVAQPRANGTVCDGGFVVLAPEGENLLFRPCWQCRDGKVQLADVRGLDQVVAAWTSGTRDNKQTAEAQG